MAVAESLALIEEVGVGAIHAHDVSLATAFRAGVTELGLSPIGEGGSAIVSVPGLPGGVAGRLVEAGVEAAARAGNLRFAFHLYNASADVERVLGVLRAA